MAAEILRTRYCSRCLTTFMNELDRCPNLGCRSVRPGTGWGELMEPGDLIDRTYIILKRLAIGGAGVTYLAREVDGQGAETGPRVAIKMLYQQRDQGPYLRRLNTEAQIIQGLHHPHIVEYMGFVHRSGHSPYLVTRYEQGGSLFDHLRRVGLLSIPVTAAIAQQVCSALSVAHRQSVIHRDLKPENVLLEQPVELHEVPRVRVADYGIAKVFGGVGDRLTRVGAFVGTPQFAAPEQFEGVAPEPATDVYAVGALIYFCLVGRPVADFMAELDPETLREHLLKFLPPRLPDTGDPKPLQRRMEELLGRAMAVNSADRPEVTLLEAELAVLATAASGRSMAGAPMVPSPSALDTATLAQTPSLVRSVANPAEGSAGTPILATSGPPTEVTAAGVREPVPPPESPPIAPPLVAAEARPEAGFSEATLAGAALAGAALAGVAWAMATSGGDPAPSPPTKNADPKGPPELPGAAVIASPAAPPALVPPPALAAPPALVPPPATPPPPVVPPPIPASSAPSPAPALAKGGDPRADPTASAGPTPDVAATKRAAASIPKPRASQGDAALRDSARPLSTGRAPSRAPWLGCGVATAGLAGVLGLLTLGVGGWWWLAQPRRIGPDSSDPVDASDWKLIASILGELGAKAEKACNAPPFQTVEITVSSEGDVEGLTLPEYDHEPTRACMEAEVGRAHFPRKGTEAVRVAVKLQR